MQIETDKELKLKNLISIRKKMPQEEIQAEIMELSQFLQQAGVKKSGPMVNTTFSVEIVDEKQLLDAEYLVPVDKEPSDIPDKYNFKPVFELKNALYARHIGNPTFLQNLYEKMNQFNTENNLQPITSAYNVFVEDSSPRIGQEDMIIDVYIGINSNKL